MTNLLTNLVYPLIYTVIGAVIGGWFAYKIAKANFMLDRINHSNECIELLKIRIDNIMEKTTKLYDHVRNYANCEDDRASSTFLENLFTYTTLLDTDISSFLSYLECNRDTVLLCRTRRISRNQRNRERYAAFDTAISEMLREISNYQRLVKKIKQHVSRSSKSRISESIAT